jgi:serine/threonine protein kinase
VTDSLNGRFFVFPIAPFVLAGVFQDDQFVYFVLEYVVGGELYMYTSEVGKLGDPDARFYTSQIVEALSYMVQISTATCLLCTLQPAVLSVLCSLLSALCSALLGVHRTCARLSSAVPMACMTFIIIIIHD